MPSPSILEALFGRARAKRFRNGSWPAEPLVAHGPLSRLPGEMASGPLSSVERLSESYQGNLTASRVVGHRERAFLVQGPSAHDCFLAGLTVIFEDVTV